MPGCKRAQRPYGVLAQVVQKSGQRYPPEKSLSTGWWNTSPPRATVLSNAYLLDSNLSLTAVDSAIHLLNKLGLEL